jgi:hypothetical protein
LQLSSSFSQSVHTQANVFDAVQQYDGAAEDEAARMFNLDQYDPALLEVSNQSLGSTEDFWKYQSSSGTLGQGEMSDYATFHDASSMSDYPDPSTAPTSRASDYKQDPMTGNFYSSFSTSTTYPLKRRRESFDASLAPVPGNVQMSSAYGRPMEQQYYSIPPSVYMYTDEQQQQHQTVMPPQSMSNRSRADGWTSDGLQQAQYVDDWPPPPAPAPMLGHRQGNQGLYQSESNYGTPTFTSLAPTAAQTTTTSSNTMMNNAMDARVRSISSDGSNQSNNTARNNRASPSSAAAAAAQKASLNEMINALGNTMDASMESDGIAKCPYPNCSKTFAKNRSYNLKAHLRSHSQLKPFACSHCPRAFSRKHDLERHARVHVSSRKGSMLVGRYSDTPLLLSFS